MSQVLFNKGVPAAVNLSLPHTTSILLTRTKVYGFKLLFTKKSVDATLLLFVYQVSINLKVTVENRYFGLWTSVF
jgi:hypothetical protein